MELHENPHCRRTFSGCIPARDQRHLICMPKIGTRLALVTLFVCPGLLLAQSAASLPARAAPAVYAKKLKLSGLPKFAQIDDSLYRGAQPHADGLQQLKKLGITTIVDLRGEDEGKAEWERKQAEALGMRFVHLPVSGWSTPNDAQLAQFFSLFRANGNEKIFVHCRLGEDRTGVFVAAYRMAFDHWSSERTLAEMVDFGFNRWFHPNMLAYVRAFPDHLRSAPILEGALLAPGVVQ